MVDDTLAGDRVAIDRPRLHRRLLASQYLRNNVLLFAAAMLAGVCNYLMHPLMLRLLGVEKYGAVISIMTLTGVLAIPVPVIALVVTRSASTLNAVGNLAQLNDLMRRVIAILLPAGACVAVIWALASGVIAAFLHLTSVQPVLLMGLALIFAFSAPINMAVLQGLQLFSWFAPLSVLPLILRLLLTVVLVFLGLGVNGAILAVVLSSLATYLVSFLPLRPLLGGPRAHSGSLRPLWVYGLTAVIATTSNGLLITIDIVLAGHYLPPHGVGLYDALATLGKTVLFISTSVVTAIFPKAAELHHRGQSATRIVLLSGLAMLALSGMVEIMFIVAPVPITRLVMGAKVVAIAGQVPWYGLAMLMFAPAQALITYFLAVNNRLFGPGMLACGTLQGILIILRHQTIGQFVEAVILAHAVLLMFMLALFVVHTRQSQPPGRGVLWRRLVNWGWLSP
jgi:O-antigen/teichoic acid export membrane protein